jgi:hypothetical protein
VGCEELLLVARVVGRVLLFAALIAEVPAESTMVGQGVTLHVGMTKQP